MYQNGFLPKVGFMYSGDQQATVVKVSMMISYELIKVPFCMKL